MHIHTVDLRCKKRCLVSACAGTDLHDYILIVVRIFGQQQDLQFLLQLLDPLLGPCQFFLQHLFHIGIGFFFQHDNAVVHILLTFFIFFIRFYNRGKIALFLHEHTKTFLIIRHRRFIQFTHDLFKTNQ